MTLEELLKNKRKEILKIAKKYGALDVRVFGSVGRGTAGKDSDVDLLVELDAEVSALGVGGIQYEVQQLLGVHVDVIPTFALSQIEDKEFAQRIEQEAVAL